MLDKELLNKIGRLVKTDNHSKYIEEEELRFLYGNVNLSCTIFELLNRNNIKIKRIPKDSTTLREKIIKYQKNNTELRNEILYDCLYFIYRISYKMSIENSISMEELVSYGYEGLMYAVNNYNKEKNYNVITYISQNIYYSIARHINNYKSSNNKLISIEEINNIESYVIEDTLDRISDKEKVTKCLDKLSPAYQEIVKLYFGFNGNREYTLNEISKKNNTSMEVARKKLRKSLIRIKNNYLAEEKNVYIKKR